MAKLLTLNQLYQLFLALNASLSHDAAFESIVSQYNLSVETQHALADFIDDAYSLNDAEKFI